MQPHGVAIREMEQNVEEPVLVVPHFVVVFAKAIHGVGNPEEVLEESEGNVLIHWIVVDQNEGNLEHALAIKSHPCCPIGLVQVASGGQRSAAIEHSDVVETEKTTREHISALWVFAIEPPVEVLHQTLKRSFQKAQV